MPVANWKEQTARWLIGGYLTARYIKEMKENYDNGAWLEAGKDTAFFAVAITPVLAPRFFFGTVMYPVTLGIGAGVITTAVIVEAAGIGTWQEVLELTLDPPTPAEWYRVVAPEVKRELTETFETSISIGGMAYRMVERYILELPKGVWANPTWGYRL